MGQSVDQESRLIGGLCEAATDGALWPEALDAIGDALGGAALVMGLHRPQGMAFGVTHRLDPAADAVLRARYANPEANPLFEAMPRLPVLKPVRREYLMDDRAYLASGLFNEVFRFQGFVHAALTCLHRGDGVIVPCGILRRSDRDFEADHLRLYELLVPHFRRALELTVRIADLRAARLHAEAVANAHADGLLVVDARGRIAYANAAALRILARGKGVRARGGTLVAERSDQNDALRRLIASAALRSGYLGGSLRVSSADGGTACVLVAMPAPDEVLQLCGGDTAPALLRVIDLDAKQALPVARLMDAFGLSRAEAVLAAELARGERLERFAERNRVKLSTVKTQLGSVFAKTGTSRQSDLVRLLLKLAEPAPDR